MDAPALARPDALLTPVEEQPRLETCPLWTALSPWAGNQRLRLTPQEVSGCRSGETDLHVPIYAYTSMRLQRRLRRRDVANHAVDRLMRSTIIDAYLVPRRWDTSRSVAVLQCCKVLPRPRLIFPKT